MKKHTLTAAAVAMFLAGCAARKRDADPLLPFLS